VPREFIQNTLRTARFSSKLNLGSARDGALDRWFRGRAPVLGPRGGEGRKDAIMLWVRSLRWLGLALAAFAAPVSALASGDVVISQVWGGSSSATGTAALPKFDFVELYNRTDNPISLSGWTLGIATSTGNWTAQALPTSGTNSSIPAHGYYLVRVSAISTNGVTMPTEDLALGTLSFSTFSSTAGRAVLISAGTLSGSACPTVNVVDTVVYGSSGACFEGAGRAPAGSATGSGTTPVRNEGGCADSDNNNLDFTAATPTPRNSSTITGACTLGACCIGAGCASTTSASCAAASGAYTEGAPCAPGFCVLGACCNNTTGACTTVGQSSCLSGGGSYVGDNTTCPNAACPASGACCSGTTGSTCTASRTQSACLALTNGFWLGADSTCTGTPCATGACCFANGSCCNYFSNLCATIGGVASASGVTCTSAGNCVSAPANDLCASATTITVGAVVTGHNFNATTTGDGLNTLCSTTRASRGIWFKFTPAATSVYEISTCGSSWDNILGVWVGAGDDGSPTHTVMSCADLSTWAYVACADDGCTGNTPTVFCSTAGATTSAIVKDIQLDAGKTYYIILASDSTSTAGNYTFTISDLGALTVGSCCNQITGQCTIQSSAACTASLPGSPAPVYNGDGTPCATFPCVTVGACCSTTGVCDLRRAASCTTAGAYQGDNTTCVPDPCAVFACCNNNTGACVARLQSTGCNSSETSFGIEGCSPSPCPEARACCNSGACALVVQAACVSPGVWQATGTTCSPNNCTMPALPANDECAALGAPYQLALATPVNGYTTGATASTTGSLCTSTPLDVFYSFTPTTSGSFVFMLTPQIASASTSITVGPVCSPFDDTLACVASSTSVRVTGEVAVEAGQTVYVRAGVATSTTAFGVFSLVVQSGVNATGACCDATSGACTYTVSTSCVTEGLSFQGGSSSCSPSNPCPRGACCDATSGACTIVGAAGCVAGVYRGNGTTCPPSPDCPASGACCNTLTGVCTTATAASCAPDGVYQGNGVACTPVPCAASLDLSIVTTTPLGAACPTGAGTPLSTSWMVTNGGAAAATGVVVTVNVPESFGFTSSTPAGVFAGGKLTVSLGSIAAAGTASVTIDGTTVAAGFGTVKAYVASASPDATLSNNISSLQELMVLPTTAIEAQVLISDVGGAASSVIPAQGSFPGTTISFTAENMTRPFASPDRTRWIMSVDTDLTGTEDRVLLVGTTQPFTYSVAVQEGVTALDLGDLPGEFDYSMGINNAGQYVWSTTTNAVANNDVVVRGSGATQTVVVREGDLAPAISVDASYLGANAASGIRADGSIVFTATLAGTAGTTTDTAVFDNNGSAVLGQEGVTIPGGSAFTYDGFLNAVAANVGEGVMVAGTHTAVGGTLNTGTATNTDMMVVDGSVVLRAGGVIPGVPGTVTDVLFNDVLASGTWLAYGSNSSGVDWAMRSGVVLARTGDPLFPGASNKWSDAVYGQCFFGFCANNVGDYVIAGTFDGETSSNAVYVANGQRIVIRENDPIDVDGNGIFDDDRFIGTFRDDRMFLTDDGWLFLVSRLRDSSGVCGTVDGTNQALLRININTGACCTGSTCAVSTAAACTGTNKHFAGGGTVCNAPGNSTTPCCKANFNQNAGLEVQDIFDFLNAWFAGAATSDINGGGLAVQDIFDFLNAWFAGC
jgi:hypothetical protein